MNMEHAQWQSLLELGNNCFQSKQWNQAEFFYSEAHDLLAFAYRNDPLSAEMLMAWVCSCHNLSSLYEAMGKMELSLRFLMVPHEYLREISASDMPNEDVKLIAFKGMSLTLPAILNFTKKYPMCDDCTLQFDSLKTLIEHQSVGIH